MVPSPVSGSKFTFNWIDVNWLPKHKLHSNYIFFEEFSWTFAFINILSTTVGPRFTLVPFSNSRFGSLCICVRDTAGILPGHLRGDSLCLHTPSFHLRVPKITPDMQALADLNPYSDPHPFPLLHSSARLRSPNVLTFCKSSNTAWRHCSKSWFQGII